MFKYVERCAQMPTTPTTSDAERRTKHDLQGSLVDKRNKPEIENKMYR